MNQLIRFLLKANFYFFIVCLIFIICAIAFGGVWKIIPYIFLLFFFYDWNVSSKINKTWLYIDTLPASLFTRYFLRVVFPFIFCFIILFSLEIFKKTNSYPIGILKQTNEVDYIKSIIDACRQTSIFVLSSIFAGSMGGYIFWIIALNLFVLSLSFLHFYIVCLLIFTFIYSYYFISKRRVSKIKFVYTPLMICLVILSFGNYFRNDAYKIFLSIPIRQIQTYSAQNLIDAHLFENRYDDNLLQKIEGVIVSGKTCSPFCYELAKIVGEFTDELNLNRISIYLNSSEEAKQIYALAVLHESSKVMFLGRVIQLAQSSNPAVYHEALAVLNNWGIHSLYDIPQTELF